MITQSDLKGLVRHCTIFQIEQESLEACFRDLHGTYCDAVLLKEKRKTRTDNTVAMYMRCAVLWQFSVFLGLRYHMF